MNWRRIIMDAIAGGLFAVAAAIITVVGSTLKGNSSDKKGYARIDAKIGNTEDTTLSGQHRTLERMVCETRDSLLGRVETTSDKLFNKVVDIDKALSGAQKDQQNYYSNLDNTQKDIKNSIEKTRDLLNDWERVITRNKELEEENRNLKERAVSLEAERDSLAKENGELRSITNKQLRNKDKDMGFDR